MSQTPPDGPDYGAPPPGGGYGAPPPGPYDAPPPGGYGTPPPPGGYGAPPSAGGYSVGDALTYGWRKFTQNLGPILLFALIVLVASFVLSVIGGVLDRVIFGTGEKVNGINVTANVFSSLLGLIGQAVFGAAIVRGALDLTEGRELNIGDAFRRLPLGPVIILAVLVAIVETIGLVLCVLPGLIAMLFLYFATYFLLDRNLSPIDAMKASVNLVRANLGSALVWALVALVVTVIGVCACLVGLLVTLPVAILGTAYTYKVLTGQQVAA